MSFRKLFHGENHFPGPLRGPGRAIARRRSRGLMHDVLPAMIETLEERTLLSAVNPGLDDHGLAFTNANSGDLSAITVNANNNAQLSNNADGSGLYINLDNAAGDLDSLRNISITGATIQNNGNAGAQIILKNMSIDTLVIDSSVFANNGDAVTGDGSGLYIELENVTINDVRIIDSANVALESSFTGNVFDGLTFIARTIDRDPTDTVSPLLTNINTLELSGSDFSGNTQNGASLTFNNAVSEAVRLANPEQGVANLLIDSNTASNNTAGAGIIFSLNQTDVGFQSGQVTNNLFDGNSGDGFAILAESVDADSNPVGGLANIQIDDFNDNVAQNNSGSGFNLDLGRQTTLQATFLRNQFLDNSGRGFNISGTEAVVADGDDPNTAPDSVNAFDIQLGDLERNSLGVYVNRNTFTGNTGAGIAIDLVDLVGNLGAGDAIGTFRAYGNTISGTLAQTGSTLYTGEGINVRLRGGQTFANGAARMAGVVIDGNTITGNAGEGIRFNVTEDSELVDLTIGNLTGENQTFDVNGNQISGGDNVQSQAGDGNTVTGNGGDGIAIVREDSSYVHDVRILDNNITDNANGIYIQASNTFNPVAQAPADYPDTLVTEVIINHNNIQNNNANGVFLRTEIDAVLLADMRYNRIDNNAEHGILSEGLENSVADFENLGGTWIKNAITNNGQGGIVLEAITGTVNPLTIGQDGVDAIDEQSLGNFIAENGQDGIDIQNLRGRTDTVVPFGDRNDVSIINNQIIGNGQDAAGNAGDPSTPLTAGKGIDIELNNHNRRFNISRNIIEGNYGDGIEILNDDGVLGVIAQGNTIQGNGGRGIDLLIRRNATGYVVIGGSTEDDAATDAIDEDASNLISGNGLEGVYVVTTAARTQRQDVDAQDALETATNENEFTVDLILDVDDNQIRDNGLGTDLGTPASDFAGTGLVVRVGSNNSVLSDSGYGVTPDLTGNASPGSSSADAGVGTNDAGLGNGRTNLRVRDNTFSGNAGDDVVLGTFVSAIPDTTTGTWHVDAQDPFDVNSYDRDPLARFNVLFTGNSGESLDVVRSENSNDYDNSTYAYTNNESEFKRRINNGTAAPNPDGPFPSGSWPRLPSHVASRPSSLGGLSGAYSPFNFSGSGSGTPFSAPNDPDEQTGTVTGITGAPVTDPDLTSSRPIRVTATLASNPGSIFLVSIAGTGTNADGTHTARLISYIGTTAVFDLYVPVDVGSYVGDDYAGGGSPVPVGGAFSGGGNLVVHNPNKFYYDGLGPSTMRIEAGYDTTSFSEGDSFGTSNGVVNSPTNVNWDVVESGTFSFLTASITDTIVNEADGTATLLVTLSEYPPEGDVFISWQAADGRAQDDLDYGVSTSTAGTLQFSLDNDGDPNTPYVDDPTTPYDDRITQAITIDIVSDGLSEETESFYVNLTSLGYGDFETLGLNGQIVDRRGVITITEPPVVSISDGEVVEGDDGEKAMEFTISLTEGGQDPVTVEYTTNGLGQGNPNGSGSETAEENTDFTGTVGSVTFLEGQTTKTISIPITGDALPEDTETFTVSLEVTSDNDGDPNIDGPPNANIGDFNDDGTLYGVGTIIDNDTPIVTIGDATENETAGTMTFTVELQKAFDQAITVNFDTEPQSADEGIDYVGETGSVTFVAGDMEQQITIQINDDQTLENTETFLVNLSLPLGSDAELGSKSSGVGSIIDDDTPTITINDVVITEGDGGGVATFTVFLSQSANVPVSVHYVTVNGTAEAGEDFRFTTGTLIIAAGQTTGTISVPIIGDQVIEPNQSFNLLLSNPVKGKFGDNTGVATLINDDIPGITITDDGVLEGGQARFTVRLSKPIVGSTVTVDYLTQSVTASDFSDYTPQSGTLTFLPGETVKTIFVDTREFDGREGTEYFFVNLVNSSNAVIADPQARGAIIDPGAGVGLVVGPRAGFPPLVRVYDATGQNIRYSFFAYDPSYLGGVKIATGDVTGDGVLDIITAPGGNNVRSEIKIWDGATGTLFRRFFAYPPNFQAAFNIASGDVNGDGFDDIIISIAGGTVSDVRGFDGETMAPLPAFLAYGRYRGGVRIAVGDVTGDGIAEIITAPGSPGAAADIRVFRASDGRILSQFFAFSPTFTGGSYNIAVGDVNGDNRADVVVSVASGLGPEVRVFNGATPQLISRFFAYAPQFRGGVSIAVGDTNFDGRADIITSPFTGAASYVRVFDGVTTALLSLPRRPYVDNFHGGTELGGNLYDANLSNVPTSPDFFFQRLDGQLLADSDVPSLEADQAQELVAAAAGRFRAAGFSQAVIDEVASTKISVADLDGETLAVARDGSIVLDVNAAGWGWFIDETPNLDEEYARDGQGAYRAVAGAAQSKVDLLSVLTHEIAHELGFDDLDPAEHSHSLMTATLAPGARRVGREQLDELFASAELMDELLSV